MGDLALLVIVDQACDQAVQGAWGRLSDTGLRVMRTFDLRDARAAHLDCTCPQHGTELCDCQMVVLLVYGGSRTPLSLVAHGNANRTWFYLVDSPQQRADPYLEMSIREALLSPSVSDPAGPSPQPPDETIFLPKDPNPHHNSRV